MLTSLLLSLGLLAANGSGSPPANEATVEPVINGDASNASRLHNTPSDVIFEDDFEAGGISRWSGSAGYEFSFEQTTLLPSVDVDTCDMGPGEYMLELEAQTDLFGTHVIQYEVTVTEGPCQGNPLQTCKQMHFGPPQTFYR